MFLQAVAKIPPPADAHLGRRGRHLCITGASGRAPGPVGGPAAGRATGCGSDPGLPAAEEFFSDGALCPENAQRGRMAPFCVWPRGRDCSGTSLCPTPSGRTARDQIRSRRICRTTCLTRPWTTWVVQAGRSAPCLAACHPGSHPGYLSRKTHNGAGWPRSAFGPEAGIVRAPPCARPLRGALRATKSAPGGFVEPLA